MSITFGRDTLCRCKGQKPDCMFCRGTGLSSGPQAPVRRDSPDTSVAAAASISSDQLRRSQHIVLQTLRDLGPMTDEFLVGCLSRVMTPSGARSRRSELRGLGYVRDSGRREKTAANRDSIVWEAVK